MIPRYLNNGAVNRKNGNGSKESSALGSIGATCLSKPPNLNTFLFYMRIRKKRCGYRYVYTYSVSS